MNKLLILIHLKIFNIEIAYLYKSLFLKIISLSIKIILQKNINQLMLKIYLNIFNKKTILFIILILTLFIYF